MAHRSVHTGTLGSVAVTRRGGRPIVAVTRRGGRPVFCWSRVPAWYFWWRVSGQKDYSPNPQKIFLGGTPIVFPNGPLLLRYSDGSDASVLHVQPCVQLVPFCELQHTWPRCRAAIAARNRKYDARFGEGAY
jgi:hypothetical protein